MGANRRSGQIDAEKKSVATAQRSLIIVLLYRFIGKGGVHCIVRQKAQPLQKRSDLSSELGLKKISGQKRKEKLNSAGTKGQIKAWQTQRESHLGVTVAALHAVTLMAAMRSVAKVLHLHSHASVVKIRNARLCMDGQPVKPTQSSALQIRRNSGHLPISFSRSSLVKKRPHAPCRGRGQTFAQGSSLALLHLFRMGRVWCIQG